MYCHNCTLSSVISCFCSVFCFLATNRFSSVPRKMCPEQIRALYQVALLFKLCYSIVAFAAAYEPKTESKRLHVQGPATDGRRQHSYCHCFLWIRHVLTSLSELCDAVGFSQVIRHHAVIMTLLQGLQKATQVLFASSVIIQFTFQKSTVGSSCWVFCWGIYADDSLQAYHALLGKYEWAICTENMFIFMPAWRTAHNAHLFYLSAIFRFPLWGETHVWPRGTLGMWRLTVWEHGL